MWFVAVFFAMVLGSIAALVLLGAWAARLAARRNPRAPLAPGRITPCGAAITVCYMGAMSALAITRRLSPDGAVGVFLSSPDGVQIALISGMATFAIAATILYVMGHPIVQMPEPSRNNGV